MTQTQRVVEIITYCQRQAAEYSQMASYGGGRVEINAAKADVWKTAASLVSDLLEPEA